jgi:D-isomer specific 2-hydroxyacid dehydrogenase, NAD binding domain
VTGRLSAVALDVFPTEPPESRHRLYADRRVICTPHTVGLTRRWNEQVFRLLASGAACVLAGERPDNLLNPDAMAVKPYGGKATSASSARSRPALPTSRTSSGRSSDAAARSAARSSHTTRPE